MEFFGVRLVGWSPETGRKLILTLALLLIVLAIRFLFVLVTRVSTKDEGRHRARFWTRQIAVLVTAVVFVVGLVSIWFDEPERLMTALGLLSAGVAIALQRVITSFAGYLILLRGRTFTVGDRIAMADVRGDVVALGFMQTTIMEMGQAPGEQDDDPSTWVNARQYTGRLVRVTNDRIFDAPVYNYTREFPYLWEEMQFPIGYTADRRRAEEILLEVAERLTRQIVAEGTPAFERLRHRYLLPQPTDLAPRVYYRLTDNWIELSLRFTGEPRTIRGLKDAISRDVLSAFEAAGIGMASGEPSTS
jgi:small-conductance mechanosensitive channel